MGFRVWVWGLAALWPYRDFCPPVQGQGFLILDGAHDGRRAVPLVSRALESCRAAAYQDRVRPRAVDVDSSVLDVCVFRPYKHMAGSGVSQLPPLDRRWPLGPKP